MIVWVHLLFFTKNNCSRSSSFETRSIPHYLDEQTSRQLQDVASTTKRKRYLFLLELLYLLSISWNICRRTICLQFRPSGIGNGEHVSTAATALEFDINNLADADPSCELEEIVEFVPTGSEIRYVYSTCSM